MTSTEIKLFDRASIHRDGGRLPDYPMEPCRLIMTALVIAEGEPVSRDDLIRAIWPPGQHRLKNQRNTLAVALFRLHRWLEVHAPDLAMRLQRSRDKAALLPARNDLNRLFRALDEKRVDDALDCLAEIGAPLAGGWESQWTEQAERQLAERLDRAALALAAMRDSRLARLAEEAVRLAELMPRLRPAAARAAAAAGRLGASQGGIGQDSRLAVVAFASEEAEAKLAALAAELSSFTVYGRRAFCFQGVGPALASAEAVLAHAPLGRVYLGMEECLADGRPAAPLLRSLPAGEPGLYVHSEAIELMQRTAGMAALGQPEESFYRVARPPG